MPEERWEIWVCPTCDRSWHKSGSKPRNFCIGDGKGRHPGTRMQQITVAPLTELEAAEKENELLQSTGREWRVADQVNLNRLQDERDTALEILREAREELKHCQGFPSQRDLLARIDALGSQQ